MINTNPFDPDPVTDCEQCSECKVWFPEYLLYDRLNNLRLCIKHQADIDEALSKLRSVTDATEEKIQELLDNAKRMSLSGPTVLGVLDHFYEKAIRGEEILDIKSLTTREEDIDG
jgi:hypothetical protein